MLLIDLFNIYTRPDTLAFAESPTAKYCQCQRKIGLVTRTTVTTYCIWSFQALTLCYHHYDATDKLLY
jgi:hypothetical protein